jgi:hypothetical protein
VGWYKGINNIELIEDKMATSIFNELPASQTNDGNIILSVNGSATTSTSALSEIIANAVGGVVTDVIITSADNSTTSFVTNGIADLTPLYTYIKSLEDRIAALEAAQGSDGIIVNDIQPTVNGNTITVGE